MVFLCWELTGDNLGAISSGGSASKISIPKIIQIDCGFTVLLCDHFGLQRLPSVPCHVECSNSGMLHPTWPLQHNHWLHQAHKDLVGLLKSVVSTSSWLCYKYTVQLCQGHPIISSTYHDQLIEGAFHYLCHISLVRNSHYSYLKEDHIKAWTKETEIIDYHSRVW